MRLYISSIFANVEECLIMIRPKHSISTAIEDNIIYVGELEIHTVLTYHCATYSVWLWFGFSSKNSIFLGPGQTTRFFTRFLTQQKIEEKVEPFGHLVE